MRSLTGAPAEMARPRRGSIGPCARAMRLTDLPRRPTVRPSRCAVPSCHAAGEHRHRGARRPVTEWPAPPLEPQSEGGSPLEAEPGRVIARRLARVVDRPHARDGVLHEIEVGAIASSPCRCRPKTAVTKCCATLSMPVVSHTASASWAKVQAAQVSRGAARGEPGPASSTRSCTHVRTPGHPRSRSPRVSFGRTTVERPARPQGDRPPTRRRPVDLEQVRETKETGP